VLNFFLILLTNIFVGTVFYLVISLKLEKSASEYQVKKFKKEIDDMITEFNKTAERNISLLENKISVLKNLLDLETDKASMKIPGPSAKKVIPVAEKKKINFLVDEEFDLRDFDADKHDDYTSNYVAAKPEEVVRHNIIKNDIELKRIFENSGNKKSLIGELFNEGYDIDVISRASNIPVGEVRLIVNLLGRNKV